MCEGQVQVPHILIKFRNVFSANTDPHNGAAPTSGRMDKRRPRLDSARRICLGSTSHEVLTIVDDGLYGGTKLLGRNSGNQKSGRMFSMAQPQLVVIWTNGGHSWIQRVEYV